MNGINIGQNTEIQNIEAEKHTIIQEKYSKKLF